MSVPTNTECAAAVGSEIFGAISADTTPSFGQPFTIVSNSGNQIETPAIVASSSVFIGFAYFNETDDSVYYHIPEYPNMILPVISSLVLILVVRQWKKTKIREF